MSKRAHQIYILILSAIVVFAFFFLLIYGISYYNTPVSERFFHDNYELLRPSGYMGHGLGIIGSLLIIIGVSSYMIRKRSRKMARFGILKHWLEFHIFLCTLGPVMILYHTSFKFGGIVSISFWSMVAVFLSGVIGRFIYIQIPRSIEGRELSLSELNSMKKDLSQVLSESHSLSQETINLISEATARRFGAAEKNWIRKTLDNRKQKKESLHRIMKALAGEDLNKKEKKSIRHIVNKELVLNRRIERLDSMKNLFKYWHVAHLPFAFVMLIIMIVHVVVTLSFGYKWIF